MKKSSRPVMVSVLAFLFGTVSVVSTVSHVYADDAETQIKNKAEDVNAESKKTVRKSKKHARKAMGTDTAAKDANDSVNNAKDDAQRDLNKTKNKIDAQ